MIRLDSTLRKIQIVLSGAITTSQLPVLVFYSDKSATAYTGGAQRATTNNTTAVDICAAPAASTVRDIDTLTVWNKDTVAATVTILYDDNGTDAEIIKATLAVGDQLNYVHGSGWQVLDSSGSVKMTSVIGNIVANSSTPALTITQDGAGDLLVLNDVTGDTSPVVINALGQLLLGLSSTAGGASLAIVGTATAPNAAISDTRISTDTTGAILNLIKSRGAIGAQTIVANGDNLGTIAFIGYDGTTTAQAGSIRVDVLGTPGPGDMPARMVLAVTPDGAAAATDRYTIDGTAGSHTFVGSASLSGSITATTPVSITVSNSLVSSGASATVAAANFAPTIAPSGGSIANFFGLLFTPTFNTSIAPATWSQIFVRPTFGASSSGTVANFRGLNVSNPVVSGGTLAITNYDGVIVENSTMTHTLATAFRGQMASASGKWNAYMDGTANNAYAGNSSFGKVTAPTSSVDCRSFSTDLVTNAAATYTVLTTDHTIIQTTAASVYTLPAAASFAGRRLHLVTQFAGTVTSASSNVVPLAGGAAGTAILAATAGRFATLQSNGTNWIIVAAN